MPAGPLLPVFATPDEVEAAFYEALEDGDLDRLMHTWADDEEVVCIHPGGPRAVGVHAVRAAWAEVLANGPLPIRPSRLHIVQSMMSSVHTVVETLSVSTHEAAASVNCYATNVYHKGPGGWRLVLHHASAAPDDAGIGAAAELPGILH